MQNSNWEVVDSVYCRLLEFEELKRQHHRVHRKAKRNIEITKSIDVRLFDGGWNYLIDFIPVNKRDMKQPFKGRLRAPIKI